MRILTMLVLLLVLVACGGGGTSGGSGQTGTTIPVGSISGVTFDGLIINGTVTVFDFTTGKKGAQLAQATSDSSGNYSLSLQVESRPVLVEVTGGYYTEEAGSGALTTVTLGSNQKLSAVANYTTGTSLKVAVTAYTHLASGLAVYEISKGTAVATAVNDANQRVSTLAGTSILATPPKEITNVANVSGTLTPELRYGFLSGAISMWTYNHAPTAATAHLSPYTSIDFSQLLYQDVSADGLLDGVGIDSTGAKTQLSFGVTPLGVNVYRLGIATALVQMAANGNNKTALSGAMILPFAQSYAANADAMFNSIAPSPIMQPTVAISTPIANIWANRQVSVVATTQTAFGVAGMAELLVDGVSIATSTNPAAPTFVVDTTVYPDGPHTIGVRATDIGGQVTTSSVQINFDNTPPTTTAIPGGFGTNVPTMSGCASDGGSGVLSVTDVVYGTALTLTAQGCWSSSHTLVVGAPQNFPIIVKDKASNCTNYLWSVSSGTIWSVTSQGPC